MSRILSILLLSLLLYNMVGYSVVYLMEGKHSVSAGGASYIERNSGSRDIVIKVPVAVPYQSSWDAPEPAEGKIEHEGEFYTMVTRQLINDTMYVHCAFDQNARDRFMDLVSNIVDEVTGQPADHQRKSPSGVLKSFLKEYMTLHQKHTFYVMEWIVPASFSSVISCIPLPELYTSIPSPPPDRA